MKVLGSEFDPKENLLYSLRKYSVLWLILIITIVFDYVTTYIFIREMGLRAEANFLMSWLIGHLGLMTGLLIGKSLQLLPVVIFVCLNKRFGNLFLLVVILINIWAVFINT